MWEIIGGKMATEGEKRSAGMEVDKVERTGVWEGRRIVRMAAST